MGKSTRYSGVRIRGNHIHIDFRVKINGKTIRHRESLGLEPTAVNLKMASDMLGRIRFENAFGQFKYLNHFPNGKFAKKFGESSLTNMTTGEALDLWFKQTREGKKNKSTLKNDKRSIDVYFKPAIGDIPIAKLSQDDILSCINDVKVGNKTKNNALIVIRGACRYAKANRLISINPAEDLENLKVAFQEPLPLATSEIDLLLNNLDGSVREYYQFAIWTGLRSGEQSALKWKDIDFAGRCFFIANTMSGNELGETKTVGSRTYIELLEPAYAVLKQLHRDDVSPEGFIFTNPRTGGPWSNGPIYRAWNKTLKQLGLAARKAYQTRHTFASLMLNAGVPLTWIQAQMRHTNYKMLETRYARWNRNDLQVADWVRKKTQNGHNGPRFTQFFFK